MKMTAIACLTALIMLSGCSGTAAVQNAEKTDTAQIEEAVNETDYAGKTVTGQVNAVSGNTAEIIPGQMVYDTGIMNRGMEGPDSMPGESDKGMPAEQPPYSGQGDFPGNMSEGIFVRTGEEIMIETDTELVTGDYIEIVFALDGSVESITPTGIHTAVVPGGKPEVSHGTAADTSVEDDS